MGGEGRERDKGGKPVVERAGEKGGRGERREGEAKRGRGGGSLLGKEGDMEGGVREDCQ